MKNDDEKILEVICKFYRFNIDLCKSQKWHKRWHKSVFKKTLKNDTVVSFVKFNPLRVFSSFVSIHDIVDSILNWADHFGVSEDGRNVVYIKNIFYGCKTLEDVLIMKDLHSDDIGNYEKT